MNFAGHAATRVERHARPSSSPMSRSWIARTQSSLIKAVASAAVVVVLLVSCGATRVLRIADDVLWMGHGPRVESWSIADPRNPVFMWRSDVCGGPIADTAIAGMEPNAMGGAPRTAWVVTANGHACGLDIWEAHRPAFLGQTSIATATLGTALVADRLWLLSHNWDLVGIDVSRIGDPIVAATLRGATAGARPVGIGGLNGRIVVAAGRYGGAHPASLVVIGVADPDHPSVLGRLVRPELEDRRIASMSVADGGVWIVHAASNQRYALARIDGSDPASPRIQSRMPTVEAVPSHMALTPDRAYVAASYGNDVEAFDISDPGRPRSLGDRHRLGESLFAAAANGCMLVFSSSGADTHFVNACVAQSRHEFPLLAQRRVLGAAHELAAAGGVLLVGSDVSLAMLDVTDAARPAFRESALRECCVGQVAVEHAVALVVWRCEPWRAGAVEVLDIAQPDAPQSIATRQFVEYDVDRLAVSGDVGAMVSHVTTGYPCDDPKQVTVLDTTDARAPKRRGLLTHPDLLQEVMVRGDVVVAAAPADDHRGPPTDMQLLVADAPSPDAPRATGTARLVGPVHGAVVETSVDRDRPTVYAAVHSRHADGSERVFRALYVVDIRDPSAPVVVSDLELP